MSVGATLALRAAASQIGYYAPNDPEPGSKYGRWAADQLNQAWLRGPSTSVWWCMIFASWAVYTTGGKLPGGISFNTDFTIGHARSEGRLVAHGDAQPGDLIIYNWDGGGTDHVGILEKVISGGVQTIEGNTSGSNGGSQSAGNGVWRRTRSWGSVAAIVRHYYTAVGGGGGASKPATSTPAPTPTPTASPVADGYWGAATTRALQKVLGTTQSSAWKASNPGLTGGWEWVSNPKGSQVIAALQKRLGITADGLIGPGTIRALQARMGTTQDGTLSAQSQCITALQQRLQKGNI